MVALLKIAPEDEKPEGKSFEWRVAAFAIGMGTKYQSKCWSYSSYVVRVCCSASSRDSCNRLFSGYT
ncbi:hypothetical protein PISMIDRAFT_689610 [Pisolithus microcarpus 441]|uniref:Uncharacterized protein n=1 Tax=Pisolithus microcarpus 441 TaxID=765257 RepID=A0A0C9YPH3_9AGAM|nr:hypothetical protein PISMIDRAFT_689610 [Pisolithus microcarpus 441]